ncbi:MAG TPA: hypothetical protein VNQ31_04700, partial [Sphingomonadaceae bacterium]|nr:hypothetical protein [Sphingomonadaceae bacterium]
MPARTGLLAMRHVAPGLRLGTELVVETDNMARSPTDVRMSAGFKLKIGTNSGLEGLAGRTLRTADR